MLRNVMAAIYTTREEISVTAIERIETDRLILRRRVPEDAEAVFTRYSSVLPGSGEMRVCA